MSVTGMLFVGVFALSKMAAAAPTSNSMTIHWLHDKRSGTVAIDVGAGEDEVPLISHQLCDQYTTDNTISWDAFADAPLSVQVDQDGLGVMKYAGETYDTTGCVAMYDDNTSLLQCTFPYSGSVPQGLSSSSQPACLSDLPDLLATLSPIYKSTLLDLHLKKREPMELSETEAGNSSLEQRSPQVGPSCFYNKCTVEDGNGNPSDTSYQVQISGSIDCTDGECDVGANQGKSQSVSFSVTAAVNEWIDGGFSVSESYSTGSSVGCHGTQYQTVCIWTGIPHKAYDVQNAECNTCGGDQNRSGSRRMTSPFPTDNAYCVRNACRHQGDGYYP